MATFIEFEPKENANILSTILKEKDSLQVEKDVAYLRDWLTKQSHLPQDIEDSVLLTFLRNSKHRLERAKKKIDNNFTLRGICSEWYDWADDLQPELNPDIKHHMAVPLKHLSPDGCVVTVTIPIDESRYRHDVIVKRTLLNMEVGFKLMIPHNGHIVVIDCSEITVLHTLKTPIPAIKKTLTLISEGYPDRCRKLILINMKPTLMNFLNLLLKMIPKSLQTKVEIYGEDYRELYDTVPRAILPCDFGGNGISLKEMNEDWCNIIMEHKDWLIEQGRKTSDESKRLGECKLYVDMFGMEGSFRALSLD